MTTMTAERRLQKIHINLMRTPMFALYSGLLMVGETKVCDTTPTACTDGRNKRYGRAFVGTLSDKELAFVVMHECLHVAFRQLTVWRSLFKINPMAANMAADFVINLVLVDTDPSQLHIAVPMKDGKPMACLDEKYRGMNTRQVFDDLMKQAKEQPSGGNGQGEGQPGQGQGGGIDEHDWEGAGSLSEEQAQELVREIDQALRQGAIAQQKLCGKGAGGMHRELGDLLAPQVNWKDQLREFAVAACAAKDVSSWRRPNRRFVANDIYMPSMIGETVRQVVIGIDTSGSIGAAELNVFLSEVKDVATSVRPERVDVIYWDSNVAGHETYDMAGLDTLVTTTKPKGGGGTDPVCVEKYLAKENIKPDCIIMLTDGYIGSWGSEWNAPMLWVIAGNPGCTAPVGKSIHIQD